jgi:hypothetical protein
MLRRLTFLTAAIAIALAILFGSIAVAGDRDAALTAIDAAIQSLQKEPGQCQGGAHVGMVGVGGHGGPGIHGEAHGSGPGTNIGAMGTAGDANVTGQANQKSDEAIRVLGELKTELAKSKPDKKAVSSKFSELAKTSLASAAKAILEALLRRWIG